MFLGVKISISFVRKIKRNINYLGTFETIAASSVVPCNMNTQIMANESTNCRLMNEFTIFFVIIVLGVVGRGGGSTIVLKWFQKTFFLVVIVSFTSIVSSSMCGDVSCGHFSSYLTLTLNVVTFSWNDRFRHHMPCSIFISWQHHFSFNRFNFF